MSAQTVQTVVSEIRASGMSEDEIADSIGCAVSTVNMWRNGHRAIRTGNYMLKLFRLHAERCAATAASPTDQQAA